MSRKPLPPSAKTDAKPIPASKKAIAAKGLPTKEKLALEQEQLTLAMDEMQGQSLEAGAVADQPVVLAQVGAPGVMSDQPAIQNISNMLKPQAQGGTTEAGSGAIRTAQTTPAASVPATATAPVAATVTTAEATAVGVGVAATGSTGLIALGVLGVAAAAGGGGGSSSSGGGGDTTAPTVSSVGITSATGALNSTLNAGDVVTVSVVFSEAVTVTGTPQAALNIGGTTVQANYSAGSGTTTLTFTYTILAAQTDANGISIDANSLSLNGGTIRDAASNNATLTHNAVADNASYLVDTTAAAIQSLSSNSVAKTVTLTFDGAMNSANLPATTDFSVTTAGAPNPVVSVAIGAANQIVLTLTNAFATGNNVVVTYTDPTAGDDANAAQDLAGNDAAGFTSGVVADGYVRGAQIYIDTNNNGIADPGELLAGVVTDANGNFFLPAGSPTGTIIAVGGVNIDTGIPNTMPLKAPAGSTVINPLTTLVQAVIDANPGTSASNAESAVQGALGIPGNVDLLNYDPLANSDVAAQKAAAQVATIVTVAEQGQTGGGTTVTQNLANLIQNASQQNSSINLGDSGTLDAALNNVTLNTSQQSTLADATATIGSATTLNQISTAQSQALDTLAPAAPNAPDLVAASDSGSSSTDNTTNLSALTLRISFNTSATDGTAAVAGDTVTLKNGGVAVGSATLNGADITNGYVDIAITGVASGVHSFTSSLSDQAGNAGTASSALAVTVDTAAPTAPTLNTVANDDTVSNAEQTMPVSGTAEANATVNLSLGGNTRTVTANSLGVWTYDLTSADITAMGQGAETLSATVTDAAGNTSTAATRSITIDTVAPTATVTVAGANDNVTPTTGNIASGGSSNDNTLDLSGAITGTVGSGEVVAVYDGSTRLGTATVNGTAWTFTTPSLSNAAHNFTARVEDAAGNQGTASSLYTVTVNATVPANTVAITSVSDNVAGNTGAIANGGVSNDTTPTLAGTVSGTLASGDQVIIYDNGARLDAATINNGAWTFTPTTALTAGEHNFTAVVENDGGNQGTASSAHAVRIDTTAPNAPVIASFAADNVVNSTEMAAGVTISGTSEAATTIDVTWGGVTKTATATTGPWSVTFASNEIPTDGATTLTATATDVAGNTSSAGQRSGSIDTAAPAVAINTVSTDDAINSVERTAGVTITGTAEANAAVTLTLGGNNRALSADGSGNWSYTLTTADYTAMGQGAETLSATARDSAGNTSAATTRNITIDTQAPTLTPFALAAASDTGTQGDNRSNDATPTIEFTAEAGAILAINLGDGNGFQNLGAATGNLQTATAPAYAAEGAYTVTLRATDAAGNATTRTSTFNLDTSAPNAPTIGAVTADSVVNAAEKAAGVTMTGTAEAGSKVNVSWGGVSKLATAVGGNWSVNYASGEVPADGATTVTATATDAAGNVSATPASRNVTVDTTAPAVPVINSVAGNDTVNATEKGAGITVDGTAEAGSQMTVTWGGVTKTATATGGNWSVSFASGEVPADGATSLTATARDAAGNTSAPASKSVTVDATAPTATVTITGADDNVPSTSITNITPASTTNDNTPTLRGTLTGTLDTGEVIAIYDGSTLLGNATVTGSDWSYTAASLSNAAHSFTARVEDAAGNQGAASSAYAFTVDATVPTATATLTGAADNVGGITGNVSNGGVSDDPTLVLSGAITGTLLSGEVVRVYDGATLLGNATVNGGNWNFTTAALTGGAHSFTVLVENAGGNQGAASAAYAVSIDTQAPAALAFTLTDTGASASDGVTNATSVNVTGLESGATWEYSTNAGGSWTPGTNLSFTLAPGNYAANAVQVRQSDAAGNVSSTFSNSASINVDVTPPVGPGLALATDSGASASDGVTNVGTVNVSGLENNATWQYSTNSGGAWTDGTGTSFTLAEGVYAIGAVQVRQTDAAGNTGAVGSNSASITVDTTAPALSAIALAAGSDTGASASDNITNDNTPTMQFTAEAGAALSFDNNGDSIFTPVGQNGTGILQTLTANPGTFPVDGVYTNSLRATDLAGNSTTRTATMTLDTAAPVVPTLSLASDTGSSASDGISNSGTVNVNGLEVGATWQYSTDSGNNWTAGSGASFTLAAGAYAAGSVRVRQTDVAGNQGNAGSNAASITIDITSPAAPGAALVADTGSSNSDWNTSNPVINISNVETGATWEYTTDSGANWQAGTGTTLTLPAGTHAAGTLGLRQRDVAGNVSTGGMNDTLVTIDVTAPTATVTLTGLDDNVSPTTGNIASGGVTNDSTLGLSGAITGTLGSGEVIAVYDGATRLGAATVNASTWTFTTSSLGNGAHSFTARVEDLAGNQGTASSAYTVTVAATIPTATATITGADDNTAPVTGNVNSGGSSNDTTLALSGAVVGTLASGENVVIYDGSTQVGVATVNGSNWTLTTGVLTQGSHSFTAVVENAAATQGTASAAYAVTIDTDSPAAPNLALASDTGSSAGDGVTNVGTVNVTGVENGASWQYSTDNGANWNNGTGTSFTLNSGTYTSGVVKVRQTDAAGNTSAAGSNAATITVDTANPAALSLSLATDSGSSPSDGVTNVGTVNVSGMENNATWQYSTNNGGAWTNGSGNSFTLAEGVYAIGAVQVRQTDVAGNTGTIGSNAASITVDTTAPSLTAFTLASGSDSGIVGDGISNDTTPTIQFTAEQGAVLSINNGGGFGNVDVGTGLLQNLTAPDGAFPTEGAYTVQLRATDLAGNTTTQSGSYTLDTVAPVFSNGLVNGSTLTLTYNGPLNSAYQPVLGAFNVLVNGNADAVTNVAVSGNNITLTLTSPVVFGDTVSLNYTDPTSGDDTNAIQDAAGNDAADLPGQQPGAFGITNATPAPGPDTTAPTLVSASVDRATLTLTYNEALDLAHQPASSYFSVTVNSTPRAVENVTFNGNTAILTLRAAVTSGDTVVVSYDDPTTGNDANAIQDAAGNDATSLSSQAVTNATSSTVPNSQPTLTNASFTGSTITISFNEVMSATNSNGLSVYLNGSTQLTPSNVTVSGHDLVITTTHTFLATDYVDVIYTGAGTLTGAGTPVPGQTIVIDGSGGNSRDLSNANFFYTPVTLRTNNGDDTLIGTNGDDRLVPSGGSDTVMSGDGEDSINLNETSPAADTVKLTMERGSNPVEMDVVYAFDVSNGTASLNDKLDLPSKAIAADTSGFVNGIDGGTVKSHSITSGIVTFGSSDSGATMVINPGNMNDAIAYLTQNITTPGSTVAFGFDGDNNGYNDSLVVFQDTGGNNDDILIGLSGVNGVTLGTSAGQNVVQIVDSQGPQIVHGALTANGYMLSFNENISSTFDAAGLSFQLGNGSTLSSLTPNAQPVISGNTFTYSSGASVAGTNYVLISVTDAAHQSFTDSNGNVGNVFDSEPGVAIGGTGHTVIDLSGLTGGYSIYDPDGGNDTLTGNSSGNDIYGGAGADAMNGGGGADLFEFRQGDSTVVTFQENGGTGVSDGDTYTFAGSVADVIAGSGFTQVITGNDNNTADRIEMNPGAPNLGNLELMSSVPTNGLAGNQQYFLQRGNYSSGIFTVAANGADTLVIYDGNASTSVSQTAFVLQGVATNLLSTTNWGLIYLSSAPADTTAPVFQSGVADGYSVTLSYNENLDSSHAPSTSAFTVTSGGSSITVNSVAVSGSTLTLGLASAIAVGATVTVSYADATTGNDATAIQDAAGNDAASLSAQAVTNITCYYTPSPSLTTSSDSAVSAAGLTKYQGADNADGYVSTPPTATNANAAKASFISAVGAVSGKGLRAYDFEGIASGDYAGSGSTYVATGSTSVSAQSGSVAAGTAQGLLTYDSYLSARLFCTGNGAGTPTSGDDAGVATNVGNDADRGFNVTASGSQYLEVLPGNSTSGGVELDFTGTVTGFGLTLMGRQDTKRDVYADIYLSNSTVVRQLTATHPYEQGGQQFLGYVISSVALSGVTIDKVVFYEPYAAGQTSDLRDIFSLDDIMLVVPSADANYSSGGDTTAPTLSTAVVNGATLTLTFSESLNSANTAAPGDFAVSVGGSTRAVNSVAVSGATATLTLASAVTNGQVVTIAYTDPTGSNDTNALQDAAGNDVASLSGQTVTNNTPSSDTTPPSFTAGSFTESANASVSIGFSEPVTASNANGVSLSLNPSDSNGWQGTNMTITGTPSGLGTSTITMATSTTLSTTDVVRFQYNSSQGSLRDLADNTAPNVEIWIGGAGASVIDLDWYNSWNGASIQLRGNGGADRLVGTFNNDTLIDGGGTDTLTGNMGADTIRLVENGTSISYARDVIRFEPGESNSSSMDTITGSSTSPTGTGFDISSSDSSKHDVLDLMHTQIVANVSHGDGTDSGVIARHSISNGLITYETADNSAILINNTNVASVVSYNLANFQHYTGAFLMDTDGNGSADSTVVFQCQGSIPLLGNYVIPPTVVLLSGITTATGLSTTAGANVIQIQDTQAPTPVGFGLTSNGITMNFAENAFATTSLALNMLKNGTDAMTINNIGGNGTTVLDIETNQTLAATDWVQVLYAGTNVSNGISDGASPANILLNDSDEQLSGEAWGSSGDNVIDLHTKTVANTTTDGFGIIGYGGNDTLTGSTAADWIVGGAGADTLTGAGGNDEFMFAQGDTQATTVNLGGDSQLGNGDTFSFANSVDRITDFNAGDQLEIAFPLQDILGSSQAPTYLSSTPTNGLVTNQGFFAVQGNYAGGVFTLDNTASGHDMLVVMDGDSTSGVTQTALLLSGVSMGNLNFTNQTHGIVHI